MIRSRSNKKRLILFKNCSTKYSNLINFMAKKYTPNINEQEIQDYLSIIEEEIAK
jgi:Mg2+ and Co2+ transporter CorA